MKPFARGNRKHAYGTAALVALCVGAYALKSDFPQFRDGLLFWLGLMLGGNVVSKWSPANAVAPEVKP